MGRKDVRSQVDKLKRASVHHGTLILSYPNIKRQ